MIEDKLLLEDKIDEVILKVNEIIDKLNILCVNTVNKLMMEIADAEIKACENRK